MQNKQIKCCGLKSENITTYNRLSHTRNGILISHLDMVI